MSDGDTLHYTLTAMSMTEWEKAKASLKACLNISGLRPGWSPEGRKSWEEFRALIEEFVKDVEGHERHLP